MTPTKTFYIARISDGTFELDSKEIKLTNYYGEWETEKEPPVTLITANRNTFEKLFGVKLRKGEMVKARIEIIK